MFKNFKNIKKLSNTVFGISLLLFVVACEDDHDHDHDDHTDAKGFILEKSDGTVVYKQFKGTTEGTITVTTGAAIELAVHFLDDDGEEIEHDEHEEEEEEGGLKVTGFDSNIAKVEIEVGHGDELEVTGVNEGSTSFKLELMHGDHADFTSASNVPITVIK